ncbi:MAG: DUF1080 domain-containing protein [Planctomycetes bacterium]|nr:DUF1080 domain-containing protein [Planctomycetota bacterium]
MLRASCHRQGPIPRGKHAQTAELIGVGKLKNGADDLYKPGSWATLEVIADGNHFIVRLNDTTTMDVRDDKQKFKKGRLALMAIAADHEAQFRNIEVKRLP